MDTRQLRYFAAVFERRNLSHAAVQCRVAQSAISHQIARLEDDLGVVLFHRQPRGMEPTADGVRLYQHARRILKNIAEAERDLKSQSGKIAGEVAVGLPYTALEMIGLALMQTVRDSFPAVTLRIVESLSSNAFANLLSGTVEVALFYNPPAERRIEMAPLLSERLMCVGRAEIVGRSDAPIPFKEVAALPQLMLRHGDSARAVIDKPALRERLMKRSRVELVSINVLNKALVAGLGCAVAPRVTVKSLLSEEQLSARPIIEPRITRRLCIGRLADRTPDRAAEAVYDQLRALVGRAVRGGEWEAELLDRPRRR